MTVRGRLVRVLLALLLPGLVLARWSAAVDPGRAPGAAIALPTRVGAWSAAEERRLDPDAFALIEPDAYAYRRYRAPGRTPIWVYAALYGGRASYGKGAHDPQVCYPAQGWEILDQRSLELSVGGSRMRTNEVRVHKGLHQEDVLYWFQPAGRWPAGGAVEQLMRVYDALAGRPQYAFVRLSGPRDPSGTASPRDDLRDFARRIAPAIREQLER